MSIIVIDFETQINDTEIIEGRKRYKIIDCPVCGGEHVQSYISSIIWAGLVALGGRDDGADLGINYQWGTWMFYFRHEEG